MKILEACNYFEENNNVENSLIGFLIGIIYVILSIPRIIYGGIIGNIMYYFDKRKSKGEKDE